MVQHSSETFLKGNANTCKCKRGLIHHRRDNVTKCDLILRTTYMSMVNYSSEETPKGKRKYLQVWMGPNTSRARQCRKSWSCFKTHIQASPLNVTWCSEHRQGQNQSPMSGNITPLPYNESVHCSFDIKLQNRAGKKKIGGHNPICYFSDGSIHFSRNLKGTWVEQQKRTSNVQYSPPGGDHIVCSWSLCW